MSPAGKLGRLTHASALIHLADRSKGMDGMRKGCVAGIALALVGLASSAAAQLPTARLDGIFPAGGAAGSTFDLTVAGANLDDLTQIQFSHPGITARPKMADPGPFDPGPVPVLNTFEVTVAADVPSGLQEVRVAGRYGVSNPRALEVGDVAEVREVEPNNDPGKEQLLTLPCLLNGRMDSGGDQDRFRFTAAAGQRILVDCRARRIDSRMDAVLTLSDATGRLVAESRDAQTGDPLLDFVSPSGGEYTLRVVDSLYGGGGEYPYRLQIGPLTHLDFVDPPAAVAGTSGPFTLYGRNLPGGQPSGLTIDGRPLEQLRVEIPIPADPPGSPSALRVDPEQSGLDLVEYRLRGPAGLSNAIFVSRAAAQVVREVEPNSDAKEAQAVTIPCDIAGRFDPAGDRDWYLFDAKAGDRIWIEAISQRLGARTDISLYLRQETNREKKEPAWAATVVAGQLQTFQVTVAEDGRDVMNLTSQINSDRREGGPEFDTRSSDPSYLFVAPADGTYRLLVRNGYAALGADPRAAYRLVLRTPQPDCRLAAVPVETSGEVVLRQGAKEAIRVVVHRIDGFDGEIAIAVEGLPGGVTSPGTTIGPSAGAASLVLECAEGAAPASSAIRIVGRAKIGPTGQEVLHPVRSATLTFPRPGRGAGQQEPSYAARLTREIVVSIAPEPAPVAFQLGNGQPIEISRGGQVKIPYTVTRRGNTGSLVCFWDTLPPNFNQQQFNIDGSTATGEFQYNLPLNTLPGTYALSLSSQVQNVQYARNPDAAKVAQERKTAFEKVFADQQAATKTAQDQKTAAEQAFAQAEQAARQSAEAKTQADKGLAEAQAAEAKAAQSAAKAKGDAANAPGDANLAQAAANAEKAAAEAQEKTKGATDAVAASQKKAEEEAARLKGATETRTQATEAAKKAEDRLRLAAERKQQLDQEAQRAMQQSQPQNVNFFVPSTNVLLKIHPAPLTVTAAPATLAAKPKETPEFAVQIGRLFGYADGVNVSLVGPPQGIPGVQLPGGTIPGGQTEVKLKLTANPDAVPGTYACQLRLQFVYNGQGMLVEQPLTLTIAKGE